MHYLTTKMESDVMTSSAKQQPQIMYYCQNEFGLPIEFPFCMIVMCLA